MTGLTKRQKQLLGFIEAFIAEHGWSPSYDEMRVALGVRGKSTIHQLVTQLIERGAVEFTADPYGGVRRRSLVPRQSPSVIVKVSSDGKYLSTVKVGDVRVSVEQAA